MRRWCCADCVPPKRHPGCHGSCTEYKKQRAELDRLKEMNLQKARKEDDTMSYIVDHFDAMRKRQKRRRRR